MNGLNVRMLGGMYVPLLWLHGCILGCLCDLIEGRGCVVGLYDCSCYDCFQAKCFPAILVCRGHPCWSVPSARALSLGWPGSEASLSLSVSSIMLTLMTRTHWPLRLLAESLPLPSRPRRLLACTHHPVWKTLSSETSAGFPDTFAGILLSFDLFYIYIYIFAPFKLDLGFIVHNPSFLKDAMLQYSL